MLQTVQNQAARLLTNGSRYCHTSPLLRLLHWLPVDDRIRYKVIGMARKAIIGKAPQHISAAMSVAVPGRLLRSSAGVSLVQPHIRGSHRSFANSAAGMFNALPPELRVREILGMPNWPRMLKTVLFPAPG